MHKSILNRSQVLGQINRFSMSAFKSTVNLTLNLPYLILKLPSFTCTSYGQCHLPMLLTGKYIFQAYNCSVYFSRIKKKAINQEFEKKGGGQVKGHNLKSALQYFVHRKYFKLVCLEFPQQNEIFVNLIAPGLKGSVKKSHRVHHEG